MILWFVDRKIRNQNQGSRIKNHELRGPLKLACVIHRYGAEIAGGSEAHCRQIAERLSAAHEVSVLTTCARDYVTWANAYPSGLTDVNGVRVTRFPVARPRSLKLFADLSDEVFGGRAAPGREEAWFRANGPDAPGLLEHLRARGCEYDLVLFWSYRYSTTYFGLPIVAERAVLVPTAEEDPAIDLDVLDGYFARPAGYLFLTPEEDALVSARAGRRLQPSAVVGIGLEPPTVAADRSTLADLGVPDVYVLYLGRIDRNKGCHTLFEYFQEYLRDSRVDTTLVLAGPATISIPSHPRIRALGFVSDDVREALLAHARALVVPSPYESLSIALLEAWNHGVPALVNAECRVLEGQVRRANGGLHYHSAWGFSEGLSFLLTRDAEAAALGRQGHAYVDREYRWPTVMARVEGLLDAVRSVRSQESGARS
jgi:glycosyltransferase involved in cell wall biosynthesis